MLQIQKVLMDCNSFHCSVMKMQEMTQISHSTKKKKGKKTAQPMTAILGPIFGIN